MQEKDILFSNNNIVISQYNYFFCKIYILNNCNDIIIFVNIAQNMRSLKQEKCIMISNKIVKILFFSVVITITTSINCRNNVKRKIVLFTSIIKKKVF